MKMNLPNKLTILRTVMILFFILFLYTDWFHGYDKIIAAVIFIAASLTDMLDGKIQSCNEFRKVYGSAGR